MGENTSQDNSVKRKALETMVITSISLKADEKADLLGVIANLDNNQLRAFTKIFEADEKRSSKLFENMIKADPETANKFQKFMNTKIKGVYEAIEKEEDSTKEAEDILKNL